MTVPSQPDDSKSVERLEPIEQCSCPENICIDGDSERALQQRQAASDNQRSSNDQTCPDKNHRFDARNYLESQRYAIEGLRLIVRNERNFRLQILSAMGVIVAGLLLGISHQDWVALAVVIAIVLVAEAFNSVVEAICDTISKDYRITIKYAKDVSAGAVMVSAIVSLFAGILIFSPYVWEFVTTHMAGR